MEFLSFTAMSTNILAAADGSLPKINEGFRRMEELVHAYEQRFTRFSEHSELSGLNRAAGTWFEVSPQMYEVLHLARQFYFDTDKLFDPGVLATLERAGYDRSIEQVLAGGAPAELYSPQAPQPRPDFGEMELADDRMAVRLPAGLRIDLGGIAKGWIAEQAARLLSRYVPACGVNAGGDQFTIGLPAGEAGWEVGLEDPFHPEQDLAMLLLKPGAVATSSVIKRRWKQGELQRHHLIDPRTGQPAETPWASVTAITDTAAKAEVLAKAMLIAGSEGAPRLIARHPAAAFMVVDMQGKLFGSENSKEHLYGNFKQAL
jgi:FAD:protein FMN transferase